MPHVEPVGRRGRRAGVWQVNLVVSLVGSPGAADADSICPSRYGDFGPERGSGVVARGFFLMSKIIGPCFA